MKQNNLKEGKKMPRIEYIKDGFSSRTFVSENGKKYVGEYVDARVVRETVPTNLHVYECRHGDEDDWSTPITIEDRVIVNFAGTFITKKPIKFKDKEDPRIYLRHPG